MKKLNFKPEWNDDEHKRIIFFFDRWEMYNLTITHGKRENAIQDGDDSYTSAEMTYGLPYTSSSSYAMLGNTNVEAYYNNDPSYSFSHLAITDSDKYTVVLQDKDENEKYIFINV